jgi:hypothetical protein
MKNITNAEHWQIVKIGETYKVFASWSGGYLDGDSWRLNSGIESVDVDGDYYLFHGYSGSIYKCHKDMEGTNAYGAAVLSGWDDVEPVGIKDFLNALADSSAVAD